MQSDTRTEADISVIITEPDGEQHAYLSDHLDAISVDIEEISRDQMPVMPSRRRGSPQASVPQRSEWLLTIRLEGDRSKLGWATRVVDECTVECKQGDVVYELESLPHIERELFDLLGVGSGSSLSVVFESTSFTKRLAETGAVIEDGGDDVSDGDGTHLILHAEEQWDDECCLVCGESFDEYEWTETARGGDPWGGQVRYDCPTEDCDGTASVNY